MTKNVLHALERFINNLRDIWEEFPDDETRMKRAHSIMENDLLNDQDLKEHCKTWPSTEGRKNLLFYTDPDYGFVINGVVRVPGRTGSVHDHADAWVLYGLLDGNETLERFKRSNEEQKEGFAEVELVSVSEGRAG